MLKESMLKKGMLKKSAALIGLSALLTASLTGCGRSSATVDLTQGVTEIFREPAPEDTAQSANAAVVTDFGVRLFQQSLRETSEKKENVLISPVSVLYALSMTANGAEGETLAQMEHVLGASVPALNAYLYSYRTSLPQSDKYKLNLANSIWFRDSAEFTVDEAFLISNAGWYDAGIFQSSFDSSTVRDINSWVSENTGKMIPSILDEIPPEAVMYLINALSFDAEWDTVYKTAQVHRETFTEEDGAQYKTWMMYSSEYSYLADDYAQGFLKYYKDRKYAFAALLPNEGISVADYAASLDGEALCELLSNPVSGTVSAAIPKFEISYAAEMSGLFKDLGMTNAFDPTTADFSGIGSSGTDDNLYISRILHKTCISVDERGTRAGAAAVAIGSGSAMPVASVYLNRPFVYMIIDCEENIPLFIGTVMSIR